MIYLMPWSSLLTILCYFLQFIVVKLSKSSDREKMSLTKLDLTLKDFDSESYASKAEECINFFEGVYTYGCPAEKSSQGFAECSAFQRGLDKANELVIISPNPVLSTFKSKLFRHYTNDDIYMIRTSMVATEVYNMFDIFYNNTNGDQFNQTSLSKFIANLDNLSIGDSLFNIVDENICLYQAYRISNSLMDDSNLQQINLQTICNKSAENPETPDDQGCFNMLRFTDLENSTAIHDVGNKVTFEFSPYTIETGLNGGQIAGIVLGCVTLVAVVIAIIIMARKEKKANKELINVRGTLKKQRGRKHEIDPQQKAPEDDNEVFDN